MLFLVLSHLLVVPRQHMFERASYLRMAGAISSRHQSFPGSQVESLREELSDSRADIPDQLIEVCSILLAKVHIRDERS